MQPNEITQTEIDMLSMICKAIPTTDKETDMVLNAYQAIKLKGSAHKIDIAQLLSVGIPMYMALSEVQKVTTTDIANALSNGDIKYDQVKQAIEYLTDKPGIFFIPHKNN